MRRKKTATQSVSPAFLLQLRYLCTDYLEGDTKTTIGRCWMARRIRTSFSIGPVNQICPGRPSRFQWPGIPSPTPTRFPLDRLDPTKGTYMCQGQISVIPPFIGNPYNGYSIETPTTTPAVRPKTIPIRKQWEFRLVECAQINPHSENAPDAGGGVTSHIEQVSYSFVAKWNCQNTTKLP